jgi:hypothetical protein
LPCVALLNTHWAALNMIAALRCRCVLTLHTAKLLTVAKCDNWQTIDSC